MNLDDALIAGTDPDVRAAYAGYLERARTETFGLYEDDVVVLDTETTGFDPGRDEIIQIAAARMSGPRIVERFSTFVDPGRHIPDEIGDLTGIDDQLVAGAPMADEALDELAEFCGSCDIVAHNASFDHGFIMRDLSPERIPGDWIDTLALSQIALPRLKDHRLQTLSRVFGEVVSTHRADDDVEALCTVWRVLLVATSALPEGLPALLASLRPDVDWPLRKVFAHIAGTQGDARFSLGACRDERVRATAAPEKADAEGHAMRFPSKAEVRASFEPDGVVGSMYANYEQRSEQVEMACEVAEAFSEGTHRVIEAGTGVGKSMAYLLPAACVAMRSGVGVGIATKTNALMDQLVYHELPRLADALPGNLSYVALKGYDHYPCLRKLERYAADDDVVEQDPEREAGALMMIAALYAYSAQTTWGDLDAMGLPWRTLPRARVSAVPGECLYGRCRFYPNRCFLHGVRQRARRADIVVTNHALLFRDAVLEGSILPPVRYWVVDEAHAVEDEARKQLSVGVDAGGLLSVLDQVSGGRYSVIAGVRREAVKAAGAEPILAQASRIDAEVLQTQQSAVAFFAHLKELDTLAESSNYSQVDLWIDDKVRQSAAWQTLDKSGRALASRLGTLSDRCRDLLDLLEASSSAYDETRADLVGASERLAGIASALRVCLDGSDDELVYAAHFDRRSELKDEALTASLLDVGQKLADEFYPHMHSVVFTSATIATGSSFEHFLHSVGLDRVEDSSSRTLKLASSYDFEHHMTVYVPTDIPDPRAAGYSDALQQLLFDVHCALGGSVLTLFTNRREMEQHYRLLRPRLAAEGIRLICQTRGGSVRHLRDEFLDDTGTSLFALRSFWDGFDAPGETLRCVVVPRLPFARPNDPLSLERARRDDRAWWRYTLPEAILDLRQAAGRLIRTQTDTGSLVLADSRLITKRYGKQFLSSLPTTNVCRLPLAEIGKSMERNL